MSDAIPTLPTIESPQPPHVLADAAPDEAAGQRYVAAIDGLLADAVEHQRVVALVDALAWTVARMIVGYGLPAAGDVLKRIGGYVGEISDRHRAQEEAAQAKKEGRPVH